VKFLIILTALLSFGPTSLFAQNLPEHCNDNGKYGDNLQALGPVIAVGASGSSGLMATPFPLLIAKQMCLSEGAGFESRYSIFFFGSKISFLKRMYIKQRPKIVIAIDHLHHSSKGKRFNAVTREYIDRELARISLDCRHEIVDCSKEGDYHFVQQENYKPTVLLGDIHAFYAVDCTITNPFEGANDRNRVETRNIGCIDDYLKINQYLRQKANEIPNLHIMPVNSLFEHLHRGLPYLYNPEKRLANFYKEDLFWDGYHPWSEPGAQVMANIVVEKINELILNESIPAALPIPYIPIKDKYYKPFTGIVLIDDTRAGITPEKKLHFVSEQGEDIFFDFDDKSRSFRNKHGDWGYLKAFDKDAKALVSRAGKNPIILKIGNLTNKGNIILLDDQISLIREVMRNSENRFLGGVVTVTK